MAQFRDPAAYMRPLYHAFQKFCRDKAVKEVKKISNNRTFQPPVPGRAVMAMLRCLPRGNLQCLSLENMIFTVAVSTPSFLDSIFGREVSKFDFRSEGYGIIQLHGPIYFKWEMCTSEDGSGPLEGIMSVSVGGWTSLDRNGTGIIKECFEPQQAKKRLAAALAGSQARPISVTTSKRPRSSSSGSETDKSPRSESAVESAAGA